MLGFLYDDGKTVRPINRHDVPVAQFPRRRIAATNSSDYTGNPADPMMCLQSQLTRTDMQGNVWGPNQRITLKVAIQCGMINGAYAASEEDLKGSIQPGQLADLVVLHDPFQTDRPNCSRFRWSEPWSAEAGNMSPDREWERSSATGRT